MVGRQRTGVRIMTRKDCGVTLGAINDVLRRVGLVLVVAYDPKYVEPTRLWIQRWATYPGNVEQKVRAVQQMGHMRIFWLLGFE
jgi:hypothetical protein